MKLQNIIAHIDKLPDEYTIFAIEPWGPDSMAILSGLGDNGHVPQDIKNSRYKYFLEVHVAMEAIEMDGKRKIPRDRWVEYLVYYAENDAPPEWVFSL